MPSGFRIDPKEAEGVMLKAGYKPLEPFTKSITKWKCLHIECGRIVYPRLSDIKSGYGGCKTCGHLATAKGLRLSEKEAVAIMLQAGLRPLEPYQSALAKWKSLHIECGEIVYPNYNSIYNGQGGCRSCGYDKRVDPKKYSAKDAETIMLKVKLQPLEPYRNSHHKWKCKCLNCGNIVTPMLTTVVMDGSACRICGNRKTAEKLRTPQEKAVNTMIEAGLEPLEPYQGNHVNWKSKCLKCGKIVYPQLSNVSTGSGCVYCTGHRIDEKEAVQIMVKAKLQPLEPFQDTKKKWKCKCLKCGNIVNPKLNTIQSGYGGCGFCGNGGIDLGKPSYIYLITNIRFSAHKIGIGNINVNKNRGRITAFVKTGWDPYRVWETETGLEALKIETIVLRILRKEMMIPAHLSIEQMPKTGGWSETVDADSITLLQLEKIIQRVMKESKQ